MDNKKSIAFQSSKKDASSSRRDFLKKVAYTAPKLMLLGQLAKPTGGHADSDLPDPPPW